MSDLKSTRKFLLGIFLDEGVVIKAVRAVRESGIPVYDVFTPYAVHGLDEVLGVKRSRLPIVTFCAGVLAGLLALFFQWWVFNINWPIIVGGKPFNAIPAFVPIIFELTVLISGLTTVGIFFWRSRLAPGVNPKLLDQKITDNHFVLALEKVDASLDYPKLHQMLIDLGATSVTEKEVQA